MSPEPKFWLRHCLVCSIILVNFYAHVAPPNLILERTPCIVQYVMLIYLYISLYEDVKYRFLVLNMFIKVSCILINLL